MRRSDANKPILSRLRPKSTDLRKTGEESKSNYKTRNRKQRLEDSG